MKKQYGSLLATTFLVVFGLATISAACAQEEETMAGTKYLVISELKDAFYSLSADERTEVAKAGDVYLAEAVKAGNILEFYEVPGWKRAVAIEQYDSVESLYEHFERAPFYPYVEFQVYPLRANDLAADGIDRAKPDPKKMKFLVIVEAKDIYYTLPADKRKVVDENNPFQTDNLLESYGIPGWNRYVTFEQYDSIESLYKHVEEDPYYPYAKFEVYPLYQIDLSE